MVTRFDKLKQRSWTRDGYLISTDHTLIPAQGVNNMFASPNVYWANPLPEEAMEEMLRSSLCFGLFKTNGEERQFIGLARCVTDFTTFVYLTDVYILPEHQGGGLGKWLIRCVDEVVGGMEWLRRAMLFTSDWERSVPFYETFLGMTVFGDRKGSGLTAMTRKGKGLDGLFL